MSPRAMEDWWSVTPDELAFLQGAESELLTVNAFFCSAVHVYSELVNLKRVALCWQC